MKKILSFAIVVTLAAGCHSPHAAAPMPPTVVAPAASKQASSDTAAQASLREQQDALRKTQKELQRALDAATKAQEQSEKKLQEQRNALVVIMKAVKANEEVVAAEQAAVQSNAAVVGQLQNKLKANEEELKKLDGYLSGSPAQIAELEKQLEKERGQREAAADLVRQREKEIADLRRALTEQQKLLKENKKIIAADKTQPRVAAEPGGQGAREDTNKWVAQGNNLLAAGKAEDAQPLFEAALKARPAMVGALVGLAGCQYAKGEYIAASKSAERALGIDTKNAQALGILGMVYRKEGSFGLANSTLEKAVKYDPADARLRNYYAIVLTDRKRSPDAIVQLRKAVEIDPAYAEAHFNLACLLAAANPPQMEEARANYNKAVSLGSERDADLEKLLNAK